MTAATTDEELLNGVRDGAWLAAQDFGGVVEASELIRNGLCSAPCLLASTPGGEQECDCPCEARYHGVLAMVLVAVREA